MVHRDRYQGLVILQFVIICIMDIRSMLRVENMVIHIHKLCPIMAGLRIDTTSVMVAIGQGTLLGIVLNVICHGVQDTMKIIIFLVTSDAHTMIGWEKMTSIIHGIKGYFKITLHKRMGD